MFRLAVSRLAPVRAAVAARSVAALRPAAAVQRLAPCAVHQPARSFAARQTQQPQEQQQEQQEEEEEERVPLTLSEARANLSESLSRVTVVDPELTAWLDEYKQQAGWQVKSNVDSQGVLLVRSVEGHEVRVTFRADDILDPKEEEEEERQPQQQAEGEEEADVRLVEHAFNIDIVSPNGRVMRLECSNASDGELVLDGFAFPAAVSADPTSTPRAPEGEDADAALPESDVIDFNDFPEEVGENVIDYLESIGVDDDLATFVAHQAEAVRQQKVQQKLTDMEKFLQ